MSQPDITLSARKGEETVTTYDGPINVGDRFIWEPTKPHAWASIEVVRIDQPKGDERRIWTKWIDDPNREPVWNDESRFREAARPAAALPSPHSLADSER